MKELLTSLKIFAVSILLLTIIVAVPIGVIFIFQYLSTNVDLMLRICIINVVSVIAFCLELISIVKLYFLFKLF